MPRNYRNYTDDEVKKAVLEVTSLAGLLRKLGLQVAGGNFANMKKILQRLNVNCSHWKGQGWSVGQQLKNWSDYNCIVSLKPHLIKKRGHKCEKCDLEKWQNEDIPLEIDHADGDRTNNQENNLKLLCCNCHALTPTWRGRNAKKSPRICLSCDSEISRRSKTGLCRSCSNKCRDYSYIKRKVKNRPSKEQLLKEVKKLGYRGTGKKYGVSDNAIRKWIDKSAQVG
jgi:hypothetical protein